MIHYFLLANIYAIVFFSFYLLLFKNSKNHSWSRFYLLISMLLCLLLPFVKLQFSESVFIKMAVPIKTVFAPDFIIKAEPSSILSFVINMNEWQLGYGIVCTLLLAQFVYRIVALQLFLNKQSFIIKDGYKLAINTGAGPASFGSVILFPGNDVDIHILKHEIAHLQLKHHFDKVVLQLIRCFAFSVIAFHLMYRELVIVHEFEADERAHTDKDIYTKTLLEAPFKQRPQALLQNFFHHPLKRRISMLYKNKSSNKTRKSLLITLSAITIVTILLLQSNSVALAQEKKEATEEVEKIYKSVEVVPEFPGGMSALQNFLAENIKYPQEAKRINREGKVVVQFVVDKDGTVTNVMLKRDIGNGCGQEAMRVVRMMPRWTPGKQDGKPVKVLYILPVTFKLA